MFSVTTTVMLTTESLGVVRGLCPLDRVGIGLGAADGEVGGGDLELPQSEPMQDADPDRA